MPVPYDFFDYPSYWQSREYEDKSERIALEYFLKIVGKRKSLADIGAGYGRLIPTYLPYAESILICDPSEKLLTIAKKRFKIKKISFLKTSLPKSSLSDSAFDVVLMIRVIHHLKDSKKLFKEISRVLKPGGFFVLEFANKIHFLAQVRAIFRGNFGFTSDITPYEQKSKESITRKKILFLNHHPKKIFSDLKENGFEVKEVLSVSNFRYPIIKKIVPLKILLFFEKICQKPLSFFYFGPSIFILAKKTYNT